MNDGASCVIAHHPQYLVIFALTAPADGSDYADQSDVLPVLPEAQYVDLSADVRKYTLCDFHGYACILIKALPLNIDNRLLKRFGLFYHKLMWFSPYIDCLVLGLLRPKCSAF